MTQNQGYFNAKKPYADNFMRNTKIIKKNFFYWLEYCISKDMLLYDLDEA